MMKTCLPECRLLEFPIISDDRGNLSFIEGNNHIPFLIQRVFYLYDIPEQANRGAHALKRCHQVLIAIVGAFDVVITDGAASMTYHLYTPEIGLLIPPAIWREMINFSTDAVCLVLASEPYCAEDYYRDYSEYLAAMHGQSILSRR